MPMGGGHVCLIMHNIEAEADITSFMLQGLFKNLCEYLTAASPDLNSKVGELYSRGKLN